MDGRVAGVVGPVYGTVAPRPPERPWLYAIAGRLAPRAPRVETELLLGWRRGDPAK